MKETNTLKLCLMEASKLGAIVWRNNTGKLPDAYGRWVEFGLCKGSSDIIGIYKGRMLAIEVKTENGKTTKEQDKFLKLVKDNGGIAFVARSEEDVNFFLTKL